MVEKLCRKGDLAKNMYRFYDEKWRPIKERGKLEMNSLQLLASTLLDQAERTVRQAGDRGQAAKWINTAMNLIEKLDSQSITALRERSIRIAQDLADQLT